MTSQILSCGWRTCAKAVAVAGMACVLMAGCGGGGGSAAPSAPPPAAAGGDGAAPPAVPIVTAPTPGPGAEAGADAPRPNSKLDCAP
ncbi:hypothetical protein [Variovorax sp. UMC13]|uniref:hypothetical protein n=1 Tax=Variovorax sp. UMC13 TaxID=1862326 RepID=UPI0015FED14E|nr:hypothetical protein [Variovorax sp. UMC13]MBB1598640.1 hypothetical protein [Variovorax sp. UMC13]